MTSTLKRPSKRPTKKSTLVKTTTRKKPASRIDQNRKFALAAAQLAIEKKATNVKIIDLREVTAITDYFVIASASSDIQVKAIADHILTEMRKHDLIPWKTEGWEAKQWIIIDFVDIVVHIFHESAREFYNLERLWADAPTEVVEDKAIKRRASTKKALS